MFIMRQNIGREVPIVKYALYLGNGIYYITWNYVVGSINYN